MIHGSDPTPAAPCSREIEVIPVRAAPAGRSDPPKTASDQVFVVEQLPIAEFTAGSGPPRFEAHACWCISGRDVDRKTDHVHGTTIGCIRGVGVAAARSDPSGFGAVFNIGTTPW